MMVGQDASAVLQEQQQNMVQQSIRELLDSNLPNQIAQLEDSTVSLERVAAYCEANYIQSQNKPASLAETKRYALQSLASVAYLVGELSRSLLHALDLEQVNLAQKTNEIQNISQLVAIQKEKAARREIGKMTTAKNILRQNKITYPAMEERVPGYQRTAIDFSILDGIGHGRRTTTQINDYGSIGHATGAAYATSGVTSAGGMPNIMQQMNRTGSTTSGDSAAGGGSIGSLQQQQIMAQPIYDHYSRTGYYGTLARGSVRSTLNPVTTMHDQYRVPQAIPSAISQQQQMRNHYSSIQPQILGMDQQQQQIYQQQQPRYASTMGLNANGAGNNIAANTNNGQNINNSSNNHYDYDQYGTLRAAPIAVVNHVPQQQPQQQQHVLHANDENYGIINANNHLNPSSAGGDGGDIMQNSADYSDDALPLPPPLLLTGTTTQQALQTTEHNRLSNNTDHDDGFPLPPPPHPQMLTATVTANSNGANEQQQQNVFPNWVPQQYMEKAFVLYDYESRNPDELRLYQGAVVYVLRKNEDGWFEGVMDGITGLFPGNYVQRLVN